MTQRIVIADNYAVFRAGAARFIAVEDDFDIIGQCDDVARLYRLAESSTGAVILFAGALEADIAELSAKTKISNARLVALLEKNESAQPFLKHGVRGILYRDVSRNELVKCLRAVSRGLNYVQQASSAASARFETDMVGERARNRLTPKELRVITLIVQGYKNKDIAEELQNSEQVIKNHLRSIFDKTGVSDRLELALFTLHHRILLDSPEGKASKPFAEPPGLLRSF